MKRRATGKKLTAGSRAPGDEKGEVAGKARLVVRKGKMFLIKPSSTNQDCRQNQRRGMKLQQAANLLSFARIVNHVVGRQPEFSQPNIEKKNRKKAGEIENVLFHRNRPAQRRSMNTQGCAMVGIVEEPLRENKIEQESQRNQDARVQ